MAVDHWTIVLTQASLLEPDTGTHRHVIIDRWTREETSVEGRYVSSRMIWDLSPSACFHPLVPIFLSPILLFFSSLALVVTNGRVRCMCVRAE